MIPVKETKQNKLVRIEFGHEPVEKRIQHFRDFTIALDEKSVNQQSRRCLHCGTPYCSAMCPLHNRPVDFNLLVREGKWHSAWECLTTTNPFPEFTSRVCPALCEPGCTQYLMEDAAVGIKTIERAIIDRAWKEGLVKPLPRYHCEKVAAAAGKDRKIGCGGGQRPRRHGLRPAPGPCRTRCRAL